MSALLQTKMSLAHTTCMAESLLKWCIKIPFCPHYHINDEPLLSTPLLLVYNSEEYRADGEESEDQDDSVAAVLEVLREGIDLNLLMQPEEGETSESEVGDSDSVSRLGEYEESDE